MLAASQSQPTAETDTTFAPQGTSEGSNSSLTSNETSASDPFEKWSTAVDERHRTDQEIYRFWTKLRHDNVSDIALIKASKKSNAVVKCNGCRKFLERADEEKLCRHSKSCVQMPASVRAFCGNLKDSIKVKRVADTDTRLKLMKQDANELRDSLSKASSSSKPVLFSKRKSLAASGSARIDDMAGFRPLSKETTMALNRRVAEYIFMRNHAFADSESVEFRRMFEITYGNSYKPPSRKYIATTALRDVHTEVYEKVLELLKGTNRIVLLMDGWEDSTTSAVVNALLYIYDLEIGMPEVVFWNGYHVSAWQKETSSWLASLVSTVKKDLSAKLELAGSLPNHEIVAVVGDRASNERGAREIAVSEGNSLFAVACASHGLHNIIKKICALPEVSEVIDLAKQVVKELTKRTVKSVLRKYLKANTVDGPKGEKIPAPCRMLTLYFDVRWGSVLTMLERIILAETPLKLLYSIECLLPPVGKKLEVGPSFSTAMIDADLGFFVKIRKAALLLSPFVAALVETESPTTNAAIVYSRISMLSECSNCIAEAQFGLSFANDVANILEKEIKILVSPLMHMAYLLDATQYLNESNIVLKNRFPSKAMQFKGLQLDCLRQYCKGDVDAVSKLDQQLYDWKNKSGPLFDNPQIGGEAKELLKRLQTSESARRMELNAQFWREMGVAVPELRELALTLNFVTAGAADGERNFSLYGDTSQNRESLDKARRDMLVFIRHNKRIVDDRIKQAIVKKRQWRRKTSANYFSKLEQSLEDGSSVKFTSLFYSEAKLSPTDAATSANVDDEDWDRLDAPDWLAECEYRIARYRSKKAEGLTLLLAEAADLEDLLAAASIFKAEYSLLAESVELDGLSSGSAEEELTPALKPSETVLSKVSTQVQTPSTKPNGLNVAVSSEPSKMLDSSSDRRSISTIRTQGECTCKTVANFHSPRLSTSQAVKEHTVLAMISTGANDLSGADISKHAVHVCCATQGRLRHDSVNQLLQAGLKQVEDTLSLDGCSTTWYHVAPVLVIGRDLDTDSFGEGQEYEMVLLTNAVTKHFQDIYSDDIACIRRVGGPFAFFLPVWFANHYSTVCIVSSYNEEGKGKPICQYTCLEGYGNAFLPYMRFVRKALELTGVFEAIDSCVVPISHTFKQTNTRDGGFLVVDTIVNLISGFGSKATSNALQAQNLPVDIKEALEHLVDDGKRWPRKKSVSGAEAGGRALTLVPFMNQIIWEPGNQEMLYQLRAAAKVSRPKESIPSIWQAMVKREMESSYGPLSIEDVMTMQLTDGVSVLQLDVEKMTRIAADRSNYRLGFWYNADYGFLICDFGDFSKRSNISDAPKHPAGEVSSSSSKDGRKKQKIPIKAKIEVCVEYSEGFCDDCVDSIKLESKLYGSTTSDGGDRSCGWVILKKKELECSVLSSTRGDNKLNDGRKLDLAPLLGDVCAVYDELAAGWRIGKISEIHLDHVPPECSVVLSSTGVSQRCTLSHVQRLKRSTLGLIAEGDGDLRSS